MNLTKIRIGNDIRLKLRIEPNTIAGFDRIDDFDLSSVKQLKCYLINTQFMRVSEDPVWKKPFLRVGFPEFYRPSHHNINNSGFPSYHMNPANMCNYDRFEPDFHDFHWWPGYRGFGIHPEHFHDHCPHLQHGPKPSCCGFEPFGWPGDPHVGHIHGPMEPAPEPPCAHPFHPEPEPYDVYGRPAEDHRHPSPFMPYYLADSQVLHEKNTLTCFFPAVQLKLRGTYKLVVVLTVFEQGWGRHNLRTYTIDKGDVFELVDDETGRSGDIVINVDDKGTRENVFESINVESLDYILATDSVMKISEHDIEGTEYNIYAKLKDGSTVVFNPYDWHFTEFTFESSDPDLVSVDKYGTITAHDFEENGVFEKFAYITVSPVWQDYKEDEVIPKARFKVTVKKLDTIKMGFDYAEDVEQVYLDQSNLEMKSAKDKVFTINNINNGQYLWILSQRKIGYVQALIDDHPLEEIPVLADAKSSGFRVPMIESLKPKYGYFCYRSVAPIMAGYMNIKIKFA